MVSGKNQGSFLGTWSVNPDKNLDTGPLKNCPHLILNLKYIRARLSECRLAAKSAGYAKRWSVGPCLCLCPLPRPLFSDSNCCSELWFPTVRDGGSRALGNRRPLHNSDTGQEGQEGPRSGEWKLDEAHFKSQWCTSAVRLVWPHHGLLLSSPSPRSDFWPRNFPNHKHCGQPGPITNQGLSWQLLTNEKA